jgi:hypothetical protein
MSAKAAKRFFGHLVLFEVSRGKQRASTPFPSHSIADGQQA